MRTILVIVNDLKKEYAELIKDNYHAFFTGTYHSKVNKFTGEHWQPSYDKITGDIDNLINHVIKPKTEINRAVFVIENGEQNNRGHVHALFKYDEDKKDFKTYKSKNNTDLIDYSTGSFSRIADYWKRNNGFTYSKPIIDNCNSLTEYITKHSYIVKDTYVDHKRDVEIDRKFFPYIKNWTIDRNKDYSNTLEKVDQKTSLKNMLELQKSNYKNYTNYLRTEYQDDEIYSRNVSNSLQYPFIKKSKQIVYEDSEYFKKLQD